MPALTPIQREYDRYRRRLRILRQAAGFSQDDLAKLARTHQTMVSLAERGVCSTRTLKALARVLGVDDPESLLDIVEFEATRTIPPPPLGMRKAT
jgi:transcriptional regulator with XRE-family HTH domain